jgi:hypothetical protein
MTLAQLADRWQTLTLAAVEAVVGPAQPDPFENIAADDGTAIDIFCGAEQPEAQP